MVRTCLAVFRVVTVLAFGFLAVGAVAQPLGSDSSPFVKLPSQGLILKEGDRIAIYQRRFREIGKGRTRSVISVNKRISLGIVVKVPNEEFFLARLDRIIHNTKNIQIKKLK